MASVWRFEKWALTSRNTESVHTQVYNFLYRQVQDALVFWGREVNRACPEWFRLSFLKSMSRKVINGRSRINNIKHIC